MKRTFTGLILLFLINLPSAAAAQDGALVKLTSEVHKEVVTLNDKGEEEIQLEPASSAMPGQVLTFTVRYVNEGEEEARDVLLTNPVPDQMVYEKDSAKGEGTVVAYSVDGGLTYGPPDTLTVAGEDGKVRGALPSDYTHIRWQLIEPVPPGGSGAVSFRASVR